MVRQAFYILLLAGMSLAGGHKAYVAVTNLHPARMTCAQYLASHPSARWLELSECEVRIADAIQLRSKLLEINKGTYVPVYPVGARQDAPAPILLAVNLDGIKRYLTGGLTAATAPATFPASGQTVRGLVRSELDRDSKSDGTFDTLVAKGVVDPGFTIIDDAVKPETDDIFWGAAFVAGGLLGCFFIVRSWLRRPPRPPAPPPLPASMNPARLWACLLMLVVAGTGAVSAVAPAAERKPDTWDIAKLAGRYTTGEGGFRGAGYLLRLSANGHYSIEVTTCISRSVDERGTAAVAEDKLRLTSSGKDSTKTVLIPIAWGPRRYLVAEDQMLGFCNDINLGIEPRKEDWGRAYLRCDDWNKKVDAKPMLPAPWGDRLLDKPIEGNIIEVKADGQIMIDRGSDHHVLEKMMLVVLDADGNPHEVAVQTVDKTHCTAKAEREFEAKVGWTVSSRMPPGK